MRTAKCVCGQLSVNVEGEPSGVYACSCKKCQRGSGSAFSYAAQFKKTALTISGEHKAHRETGESGNWTEGHFCPTCGANVFSFFQNMPDEAIVSAGCFEDSSFDAAADFILGLAQARMVEGSGEHAVAGYAAGVNHYRLSWPGSTRPSIFIEFLEA